MFANIDETTNIYDVKIKRSLGNYEKRTKNKSK